MPKETGEDIWEEKEWEYCGEGARHVVFAASSTSMHRGSVVRFAKDDHDLVAEENALPMTNQSYMAKVVKPCLGSYVDLPRHVLLPLPFVQKLKRRALQRGQVPPSRLSSSCWSLSAQTDDNAWLESHHKVATIHPNYRQGLSVEIKPKAGQCSMSPLVHPLHRAKLRHSRFEIMQQLLSKGHATKGWIPNNTRAKPFRPTNYNPIDLFSDEQTRIHKAIFQLIRRPQNYLKIHQGSRVILDDTTNCIGQGTLPYLPVMDSSDLATLIAAILAADPFLVRLKKLQQVDWLDADGAVLVYDRLLLLCDGHHDAAQKLVDNTDKFPVSVPFEHSPFSFDYTNAGPLLELVRVCRIDHSKHSESDLDAAYRSCEDLVATLDKPSCIFLLQTWLFGLCVCDMSFCVTIAPPDPTRLALAPTATTKATFNGIEKEIGYRIKVIDCDQKPASKLRTRAKKEQVIRSFR